MGEGRRLRREPRRAVALTRAVIALAITLALVVRAAGASSGVARQPRAIQAASLVQAGQDLVWQVELAQPFTPGRLRRDRRSLCLLIEGAANGSVVSRVCLSGPRPGARAPQLIYMPGTGLGPGPGSAIAATITRASDRDLTVSFLPASVGLAYRALRWHASSVRRSLAVRHRQPQRQRLTGIAIRKRGPSGYASPFVSFTSRATMTPTMEISSMGVKPRSIMDIMTSCLQMGFFFDLSERASILAVQAASIGGCGRTRIRSSRAPKSPTSSAPRLLSARLAGRRGPRIATFGSSRSYPSAICPTRARVSPVASAI